MGARLRPVLVPATIVTLTIVTTLAVLKSAPAPGTRGPSIPPLGSATLVFSVPSSADPRAIAAHLAGPSADVYDYGQICGGDNPPPRRYILPLAAARAEAILAQARADAEITDPVLSVWPCGVSL